MKLLIFILSLFYLSHIKAQSINRDYVIKWIKAVDSTYTPDSVIAYYIDGGLYYTYDSVKFNVALKRINFKNLKGIYYSRAKMDNYVPGRGEIGIILIKELERDEINRILSKARNLFFKKNSKEPVLLIDKIIIPATEARSVIEKFDPNIIYDIDIKTFQIPETIYGQNANNGIVQIWTKKYVKE